MPELTSLFATLASSLQSPDQTARNELDHSISNLNRTLNPTETPTAPVLDAALSLMGFNAPQVYDSVIECTVKTIVAVLRTSIECKALRNDGEEVLRVGGSIRGSDCASVVRWCVEVLGKLEGRKEYRAAGDLCASLFYAAIKVAAFAPLSQSTMLSMFDGDRAAALASSLNLVNKFNFKDDEVSLRSDVDYQYFTQQLGSDHLVLNSLGLVCSLLLWHLDPMLLKQDISQILQEVSERPFLSLNAEIYERMEWRSKIICLVFSPSMFTETRALLHDWFLVTGLASIMELQTEFVAQVLDIISRPMWWGISMEVGAKLPFSQAYFPHDHQLLRTLAGPITAEHFQQLLNKLSLSVAHTGGNTNKVPKKSATKISMVDHKSMWSLAMNFPGWMCFASVVLFHNKSPVGTLSGFIPLSTKPYLLHDVEVSCSLGAARYISWLLDPISKSGQALLFDYLCKVSELWTQKHLNSSKSKDLKTSYKSEIMKLKLHDEASKISNELDTHTIGLFLQEINDMYIRDFGSKVGFPKPDSEGLSVQKSLLLRMIPLGILIGYTNHLNAGGCGLLLQYAATGSIQKFPEVQSMGLHQRRRKRGQQWDSLMWIEECTKAEAVAGCRIVFDTTNLIETISPFLFETEEGGQNFMFQVKMKTGDYLLKCIKRLLQVELDKDGLQMRRDLLNRVKRWRQQGKDVISNIKDFDHICDPLNVQQRA